MTNEFSGFARWQRILQDVEQNVADGGFAARACPELQLRILRVAIRCGQTPEDITAVITAIAKGYALVRAAAGWKDAVAGQGAHRTARCRGEQWRLAMAWGGTETILKSLGAVEKRGKRGIEGYVFSFKCVPDIVSKLSLPALTSIVAPSRERKGLKWWLEQSGDSQQHRVLIFLDCRIGAAATRRIEQWLIDGIPVATWDDALLLAQAFRHTSVHGALSATKVAEWGLTRPFAKLTDALGVFVNTIIDRLAAPLDEAVRQLRYEEQADQ